MSPFGGGTVVGVLRVDSHPFPPESGAVMCEMMELLAFLQAKPADGRDVVFHII